MSQRRLNKIYALGLTLGLAMAGSAHAQAFKCVDADGAVTYTNVGSTKGCKKIEGEVNTVSTKSSVSRPPQQSTMGKAGGRDGDRKRILEEELAAEEKRLAELKKEYNNGEPERNGDERNYQKYLDRTEKLKTDVSRGEANIESLKRELGNAR